MTRFPPLLGALLVGLLAGACGRLDMKQHYAKYRPLLLQEQYAEAVSYVDKGKEDFYGQKNRLLYYMDRGMLLALAGKYQESNEVMEKAKQAAEELWTESIGENALAWVTTDNSLSYAGEDFEKVLLHWVAAQNYLALKDYSAARVEARQITNRLELYNQKYEELGAEKSVYRDDAFARWLAGMLAETEGGTSALNDAWIDYKKALQVYREDYKRYDTPLPRQLVADALRVLNGLGADFQEEYDGLRGEFPSVSYVPHAEAMQKGRIVLLHSAGEAPTKVDDYWTARVDGEPLRIAFPKFVPKHYRIGGARLVVGAEKAPAELAEDVTAIAIQNLADHMGRIRAKAIARAVAKFTAGKVAQKGGQAEGGVAGALIAVAGKAWNVGNAIAEEADKRSWVTLPGRVTVSQMFVEPGTVEVIIEYLLANGRPAGGKQTRTIDVKAGETVFIATRTFN